MLFRRGSQVPPSIRSHRVLEQLLSVAQGGGGVVTVVGMHRAIEVALLPTAALCSGPHLLRVAAAVAVSGEVGGNFHEVPAELLGLAFQ